MQEEPLHHGLPEKRKAEDDLVADLDPSSRVKVEEDGYDVDDQTRAVYLNGASSDSRSAAQKALLAHTAPHLFPGEGHSNQPSPSSSRSPSPSSSSPSTSRGATPSNRRHIDSATPSRKQPTSSKHTLPPNYRGPPPKDTDAEDIAPLPTLQSIPTSETLFLSPNTPLNRNSWRYTFAGPDTARLPQSVYRSISALPEGIRWDWSDRSAFTRMSSDAQVVSSEKGWRAARSNIPVREGSWYCEIEVLSPEQTNSNGHHHHQPRMKDGPHVRLGWARREAPLNAPIGFDGYSYGLRDTSGQRVFLSRPSSYGQAFQAGDVIGLYIHLPPLTPKSKDPRDPRHIRRKRIPIRYRGQLYFEQLDYAQSKEMEVLMDRSWAGEQLVGNDGAMALPRANNGELDPDPAAANASKDETEATGASSLSGKGRTKNVSSSSGAGAASGTGKSKRQAAPGKRETGKQKRDKLGALRTLPTLGSEARIGFFLNGQPMGWAFQDLLDFRPLRIAETPAEAAASRKLKAKEAQQAATASSSAGLGLDDAPLLTTSATLAAIMKSRENPYDDGSTGYFPAVSLYGGARARLKTRPEELSHFVNPSEMEAALENAERAKTGLAPLHQEEKQPRWWGQTRALSERYDEYWQEQWKLDLEEEERAVVRAKLIQQLQDEADAEDEERERKALAKGKKKTTASKVVKERRSHTPKEQTVEEPAVDDSPSDFATEVNGGDHRDSRMSLSGLMDQPTSLADSAVAETPTSPVPSIASGPVEMDHDGSSPWQTATPPPRPAALDSPAHSFASRLPLSSSGEGSQIDVYQNAGGYGNVSALDGLVEVALAGGGGQQDEEAETRLAAEMIAERARQYEEE